MDQFERPCPAVERVRFSDSSIIRTLGRVLLLGPSRTAVSGVSTHLNQLFGSELARRFDLIQFQIGSEGRTENALTRAFRTVTDPFRFAACIVQKHPDIVHINTSLEQKSYWRDAVFLVIAKLLRTTVIYQVHGGALPRDFFRGSRGLTWLLRRVLSMPDVVVLLASIEANAYREFVPKAHIELIPNATDIGPEPFDSGRYSGGRPLKIIYMGRLAEVKGIFDVVEAVRILRMREVECRLAIAGTGPDEDQLRQTVDNAGLNAIVTFAGAVFGAEKAALWRRSDVFAFPTFHREGLPYALLESMEAGAVPIVTRVGAIPDVVSDGIDGRFVSPRDPVAIADAISQLHGDRETLRRMALAARRKIVDRYSVARLADAFSLLYQSVSRKCAASLDI